MNARPFSLSKKERINSRKLIEELFHGGHSRSISAFPVRMVYMETPPSEHEPQARMMTIVSKRHFKHAVDRNRAKRQMREAYRKNKHTLLAPLQQKEDKAVAMAFVWMSDAACPTATVEKQIVKLLQRLSERL